MQISISENKVQNISSNLVSERIYLDNAATTPLEPKVLETMLPYMSTHFGNPSSIYSYGRETRLAIENARKTVARLLGAKTGEIFFTSGGTESNNTAIATAIRDLHCRHIISSPIEHHAVLHTVEYYGHQHGVATSFVKVLESGDIDYADLEQQLRNSKEKVLVSLMHANNEIGNVLDIERVGNLCKQFNAIFHSDCVQTVGHYPMNLSKIHVHFISGAGHKFHGPKGIGILYVNENVSIKPFILGGGQERNMRAGTENVYGIIGFAKALELAMENYEKDSAYIKELRLHMMQQLKLQIPGVSFNCSGNSLYTVLSASFPKSDKSEMLLFNLDINNICVSGGSACSSGASVGSHVMQALNKSDKWITLRFSFSKFNRKDEIDTVIEKLKELI
jgi:cysteine desulfurase